MNREQTIEVFNFEWRPLDTAPTGEPLLVAYKFGLGCAIAHKDDDGNWHGHEGADYKKGVSHFSHWGPLPEPPEWRP